MKKYRYLFFILVVLLISASFLINAAEWDNFEAGSEEENASPNTNDYSTNGSLERVDRTTPAGVQENYSSKEGDYTSNFYTALAIAGAGLLILIVFLFLLLRRPKDHFKIPGRA